MRFCLVSTQQHWGGGEALLLSISRQWSRSGHAVSWIVREESQVHERLAENGQHFLHCLRKRGGNWHDWSRVVRVFRQWAPDVVILNDTHAVPIAGAACWFCRSPRPIRLAYKHTVFPLRSKLKYRWLADQMICVSAAARETLLTGGMPADVCHVIYGGCNPPEVNADQRVKTRESLGLSSQQLMLVSVGSLLDIKGHADLIQAMPLVVKSYPNVRLFIAGDGDQRSLLDAQVEKLQLQQHVRLMGYRQDADHLLAAADLVVHPSHAEGLSLVLIQAQMLEKPIVATAVGGAAEVLQTDAPELCSSWIAEPQQPTSLARQIESAITMILGDRQELNQRLSRTAIRAHELFDVCTNSRLLADYCAQLLVR